MNYRHASQPRRGGIGPMVAHPSGPGGHQVQMTPQQMQLQHQENMRQRDVARRQAKKPTDREIPDEVSEVIVGDGLQRYKALRDVEKRLDAVIMRKRLDVHSSAARAYTSRREGVLRVWISNTAEGQPWQVIEEGSGMNDDGMFDLGETSQAAYRVKIEGRLLEDPELDGEGPSKPETRLRLSSFFKSITIDFDRNPALQPDGYEKIEWKKRETGQPTGPENSFDCLEFRRKADENMNVTINLVRAEEVERFRFSPQMRELLDIEEDSIAAALQAIWEYARANNLQEDDDRRTIVCDDALRKLFNADKLAFPYLPDLFAPHIQKLPPIKLAYTIRLDKPYISPAEDSGIKPSAPTIYDIRVPLPDPVAEQLAKIQQSKTHLDSLQSIVSKDDDLALLVQKLHQTNAKRKFYENLAKDPANFVKRWVSSQQRDLEVILAEAVRGGAEDGSGEEWRRGGEDGVWGSQVAKESVGLWLARQSKAH